MIVWLASYPRSGNILLWNTLEAIYGVKVRTVYPTAARYDYKRLGDPEELVFLKTHETVGHPQSPHRAIVLARDGRDAIARNAVYRKRYNKEPGTRRQIMRRIAYEGRWLIFYDRWGWRTAPHVLIHFRDMIADLDGTVKRAVETLDTGLKPLPEYTLPELRPAESVLDVYKREMPAETEAVFWDVNGEMMDKLGYGPRPGAKP